MTDSRKGLADPFQLRMDGHYHLAIEEYSRRYLNEGGHFHLFNRGMTYLDLGNYTAALEDFKLATITQEAGLLPARYYFFQGVCYWYLDQPSQAVEVWHQSLATPYGDAAGGVENPALLLYAAERLDNMHLRQEAIQLLRKHSRRKLNYWPGAIVPFLLAKIEMDGLESAAKVTNSEIVRARHQCQADFYIALRALREGNRITFESFMASCAKNVHGLLEHEHYLARWEVQRGFPEPAFRETQESQN